METTENIAIYTSVSGLVGLPFTSILSFFFYFIEVQQEMSLLLFLNIDLPLNMQQMLMVLKNFQINSFLPDFFKKNSTVNYIFVDQMAPTKFRRANFSSSFLGNGFSVFLLTIVFPLFLFGLFIIMDKYKIQPRIITQEKKKQIKTYIFYNFTLSLLFSGSAELSLFIALQLMNVSFYNFFNGMSFFFALVTLGYLIAAPIFIFKKIKSIETKIKQDPNFEFPKVVNPEFESIFIDLNLQKGIYFPMVRIIKKVLVSFIQVFFYANYMTQIILRIILAVCFLIYVKQYEPFKYKIFNAIYEYTELGTALLLGLLLLYYKATPNDSGNNIALILGVVCILLLMFLIVINTLLMIFPILYRLFHILKLKLCKKQIKSKENEDANTSRARLINDEKNVSVELIKIPNVLGERKFIDCDVECHFLEEELTLTKKNHEEEITNRNKREKKLTDQIEYLSQKESRTPKKLIENATNTSLSLFSDFKEKHIFEQKTNIVKTVDVSVNTIITRVPEFPKNKNLKTNSKKPKEIFKKVEGWELSSTQTEEKQTEFKIKNPHL